MAKDANPPTDDPQQGESDTDGDDASSDSDSRTAPPSSEETDSEGANSGEEDLTRIEQRLTERIIDEELSVLDLDAAEVPNQGNTVTQTPDSNFTPRPNNPASMRFVEVQKADIGEFNRELAPPLTGRHRDLVAELNKLLDKEIQTFSLSDLAERVDPEWGLKVQREYLNPIEKAGGVDKVKALDNNSREPVQIQKTILRHLNRNFVNFDEQKEAKRIIDYQWSAYKQATDPTSDVTEDAQKPRKGWLYGILGKFAETPSRSVNPKIKINFRQVGRPDYQDTEWQEDFKYADYLFPDQQMYDHLDQYAILIDIHYRDWEIERPGLEDRLEEELVNYHAVSLHENEIAITGVDSGDPEDFLEQEADPEIPDKHAPPLAQVPWFDYDATVIEDSQLIRLQSLYQQEST